jgi:hypothetical protein
MGREKTISDTENKPSDETDTQDAPDVKEAQVDEKSTNPPIYHFKAGNQNAEDVFSIKNAQILKDKRTNPQATGRGKKEKVTGQNITGKKAPARNHVSGSVQTEDAGKSMDKGQVEDKVGFSSSKHITSADSEQTGPCSKNQQDPATPRTQPSQTPNYKYTTYFPPNRTSRPK